jgi:hypothetical protein
VRALPDHFEVDARLAPLLSPEFATASTDRALIVEEADGICLSLDGSVVYVPGGAVANDFSDDHIQRFQLPGWSALPPVPGHTTPAGPLALSGDGTRLASVGQNGTIRLDCVK